MELIAMKRENLVVPVKALKEPHERVLMPEEIVTKDTSDTKEQEQ